MGARLCKPSSSATRRVAVEERYCKPSGNLRNIDGNRLKKLILAGKLSPCYPGLDESDNGLDEECPICFLHYPALNRSKCCQKGLCTECFLQVKAPPNQQVACPFCKVLGYAVVYRGKKSAEELQRELLEDQRVIEARIRARQSEQATQERTGNGHSRTPSSSAVAVPASSFYSADCPATPPSTPLTALPMLSPGGSFSSREGAPGSAGGVDARDEARRRAAFLAGSGGGARTGEADARRLLRGQLADHLPPALLARTRASDIDLEDLMLMEAIWRSLQTQPQAEASAAPAAAPASAQPGARASDSDSMNEEDEFDDATTDEGDEAAASTADASPGAPALSEAEMQRAMSLPRESGMPDVDVSRGALSRRPSESGGQRPLLRSRSGAGGARLGESEMEQLRNWGSHATPAAAAAAEEEMMAIAMRLSLEDAQPTPTPAVVAASPAPEPDPDAAAVATLVASAVTAAVTAAEPPPPASAA